ncbi:MAG: hypothetical protein GY861_20715 [bacterium]|nr:hypothetical protein [bacterium]
MTVVEIRACNFVVNEVARLGLTGLEQVRVNVLSLESKAAHLELTFGFGYGYRIDIWINEKNASLHLVDPIGIDSALADRNLELFNIPVSEADEDGIIELHQFNFEWWGRVFNS